MKMSQEIAKNLKKIVNLVESGGEMGWERYINIMESGGGYCGRVGKIEKIE